MRIADNVEFLEVENEFGKISTAITWDDHHLVLFDTGFPGQTKGITDAISTAGFRAENLTHIILTHHDLDHIGNVLDLQRIAPSVRILAHEKEAPYMDGRKTPVKLAAMLAEYDGLSEDKQAWYDNMKKGFASRRISVTEVLQDGMVLPICGGIEVVHTPGHTPGHITLYLRESRIMICGDAAYIKDGKLVGPNPEYTQDMVEAMQSLKKIKSYDMHGAVAYHCGYCSLNKI